MERLIAQLNKLTERPDGNPKRQDSWSLVATVLPAGVVYHVSLLGNPERRGDGRTVEEAMTEAVVRTVSMLDRYASESEATAQKARDFLAEARRITEGTR